MPVKEFLDDFRNVSSQLSLLQRELLARPEPIGMALAMSPQARRLYTRARRMQLRELAQEARSRWDQMSERLDALLTICRPTAAQRAIVRQFYGAAMTDQQIAGLLGLSAKTVQQHRMRWVKRAEEQLQ